MTEGEARQKWCPLVRVTLNSEGEPANNRPDTDLELNDGCIASDCMAWRDTSPKAADAARGNVNYRGPTGYCGLAGKP